MKNFTPELIKAAKAAKSVEELFELAKANNVEITEEEAKTYFTQLNAGGEIADDELDAVAGGNDDNDCFSDGEDEESDSSEPCPKCGKHNTIPIPNMQRHCIKCGHIFKSNNRVI
jgi:hypothetical protein